MPKNTTSPHDFRPKTPPSSYRGSYEVGCHSHSKEGIKITGVFFHAHKERWEDHRDVQGNIWASSRSRQSKGLLDQSKSEFAMYKPWINLLAKFCPNLELVDAHSTPAVDFGGKQVKPDIQIYSPNSKRSGLSDMTQTEMVVEFKLDIEDDAFNDNGPFEHSSSKTAPDTLGQITLYATAHQAAQFRNTCLPCPCFPQVTDAVHANGSFIYAQLWALGRAADTQVLKRDNDLPYVSSSPKPLTGRAEVPRALTEPEIMEYVHAFATAAENAIAAGFDGVEVHGANGYLVDQFLQDVVNARTDEYGGSIENRSRFGLEVLQAIFSAVGQDRVGIRLSPWNLYQDMRMAYPFPQFTHFITSIRDAYPDFAYIHLTEPDLDRNPDDTGSNDPFRAL
ncbi:hypothetical protein BU17DRAFT_102383 [Hysterangium stoloniferum]|nr:hypothetical protein BU17DRAFT_102383 [Hysterangium stoloniferum]